MMAMEKSETVRILDLCERCRDKLRDAGYRAELVPGTSWLRVRCDQCGKQVRFGGKYEVQRRSAPGSREDARMERSEDEA